METGLSKERKFILEDRRASLTEDISLSSGLLDHLLEHGFFKTRRFNDLNDIKCNKTRTDCVTDLLVDLGKSSMAKYDLFCVALRVDNQHQIAQILQPSEIKEEENEKPEVERGQPRPKKRCYSEDTDSVKMIDIPIHPMDETLAQKLLNEKEDVYRMTSVPLGRVVIINNVKFAGEDREGSDTDSKNLQNLFKKLNFDVVEWRDLTAQDIKDKLKEESRNSMHEQADAFVLVILSHGCLGKVSGVDGKKVKIQKHIVRPFDGDRCPQLIDKPKLFIIQACQGGEHGATVQKDAEGEEEADINISADPKADTVVALSTVPGRVSYRNTVLGSWFIRDFVEVISRNANKDDLLSMLTKVNQKVNARRSAPFGHGQLPQQISQLRKKVYFFPGYPSS